MKHLCLKKLIKSKKGGIIDAIIIVPLWILIIAYIGGTMSVKKSMQENETALQLVSRYISSSNSLDEGLESANLYLNKHSDSDAFDLDNNAKTIEILSIYYMDEDITNKSKSIEQYWNNGGLKISIKLTRKTPFYNNKFSFSVLTTEGKRETFSILEETVSSEALIINVGRIEGN